MYQHYKIVNKFQDNNASQKENKKKKLWWFIYKKTEMDGRKDVGIQGAYLIYYTLGVCKNLKNKMKRKKRQKGVFV